MQETSMEGDTVKMQSYEKVYEKQKLHAMMELSMEGVKVAAADRPSREQLLLDYGQEAAGQSLRSTSERVRLISNPYPPCTLPLSDLTTITIAELQLSIRHVGRVLIVRTFGFPKVQQYVQNAIEDMHNDVGQLGVYDPSPEAAAVHTLGKDAIFAIKEPRYRISSTGRGYIIQVEHPSDLIRLQPNHPSIPNELVGRTMEIDHNALHYKLVGNAAFQNRDYLSALKAYTRGLDISVGGNNAVKHDLYRSRAEVNLLLEYYEQAARDATAAFYPDATHDDKKQKDNIDALSRAGQAFYHLEKYQAAKVRFEQLLCIAPNNKDAKQLLSRTNARLREANFGDYDFTTIGRFITPTAKHLDHASFTANVSVRDAGHKGKGLFATKRISAGELVLVEKAFSISSLNKDGFASSQWIVNLGEFYASVGVKVDVVHRLIHKATHNPAQYRRLLQLHSGAYTPKCTAQIVDGVTVIDVFQIDAIMRQNFFTCPATRTADEPPPVAGPHSKPPISAGVWITTSFANHACDANARRSFIGDCLIVRAVADIEKDEEITMAYQPPDNKEMLEEEWNFKCRCNLCTAKANTPTRFLKARDDMVEEIMPLMQGPVTAASIVRAEHLYKRLNTTYDEELFKGLPRVPVAKLAYWLCTAYSSKQSMHKVIEAALMGLRGLGHRIENKAQILVIDRGHSPCDALEIKLAMFGAHAAHDSQKFTLSQQFEAFARERYMISFGEMRGFAKMYGSV